MINQPSAAPTPDPSSADVSIQNLLSNNTHPDFVPGLISDPGAEINQLTPIQGDFPRPFPPFPVGPRPRDPFPPFPPIQLEPPTFPVAPTLPILPAVCQAVSGRYKKLPAASEGSPLDPLLNLQMTVRVDVDRFHPQQHISIEVIRPFPQATACVIAEVTSDQCLAFNKRRITATIAYRDGDPNLIRGTLVTFEAARGRQFNYANYKLTLSGPGMVAQSYALQFESVYFDAVEFEIDQVEHTPSVVTAYDTGSHPNRPSDLPTETLSLQTIYQRAGFDASISANSSTIPVAEAGANATWSDGEMHNAMLTYWSKFEDKPQWALWVLYAARHDDGPDLGGIMFDTIGPNHRQGTAIFTDSFIQNVPNGDSNPAAWRNRMTFWTAVHEMGHAFNLAHSWQKENGVPWVPLKNEPEARSFMNYPYAVNGEEAAFFADFRFRFSDAELLFMRHAPRRFVQMGNANWATNHNFEAPPPSQQNASWNLAIRPNRDENIYRFLEPVVMEFKLTHTGPGTAKMDEDVLADGKHITVFIQRHGGATRRWRAMSTQCHQAHHADLATGESIYGSHMISASADAWLIDEPGFYKIQAAVQIDDHWVLSNVLRLYVSHDSTQAEQALALDYFTQDVARTLVFNGAPFLSGANATLHKLIERCPANPAAIHAQQALSTPLLRNYKRLEIRDQSALAIVCSRADIEAAHKTQQEILVASSDQAAPTLGHLHYFSQIDTLANVVNAAGNRDGALKLREFSLALMKQRKILPGVVRAAETRLQELIGA